MNNWIRSPYVKIVLIYILAQFVPALVLPFTPEKNQFTVSVYATMICFILGTAAMLWTNRRSTFDNSLENSPRPALSTILTWGIAGTLLAFVGQYVAVAIEFFVFHLPLGSQNTQDILLTVGTYPLFLLLVSILGPVMEEFVFRKVIFGFLYDVIGGIGAAVISSLAFAFIHMDGHILIYSFMGFVFSFIYFKTKSIAAPIISHALMNSLVAVASLMYY
ncbi:CPBP family intramembrane glutamic endopeptidase [Pisciglobus halotolerans]|uniref:CAAX prenyl protease 2/Lysostaphin resistance protein A-like domain-containing protein n=1 Tax=Pisciglobus halotolerans TaxID=745365 RepID=A0A1I3CM69_9LACT|nr:type II CAAX endopeptidase family protein [Pisciglobus halotolerans]SFH75615.1 hypothetical protein SAMN04489868_1208 [Pisciglobus halotolerans]